VSGLLKEASVYPRRQDDLIGKQAKLIDGFVDAVGQEQLF